MNDICSIYTILLHDFVHNIQSFVTTLYHYINNGERTY
jgi:hypothetical protein